MALGLSNTFSTLSGSVGGTTYFPTAGGIASRRRAIPRNPNSQRQMLVRANITGAVQAWLQTLDDTQRSEWNVYAKNTPVINKLGQAIHLSGQNMFIRAWGFANIDNTWPIALTNLPYPLSGPSMFNTGEAVASISNVGLHTTVGPPASTQARLDTILTAPASADGTAFWFIGRPINNSRKFYGGPWQLVASQNFGLGDNTVGFTKDIALTTAWMPEAFPVGAYPFTVGQWQNQRIVLAFQDGRVSMPFAQQATVVTIP